MSKFSDDVIDRFLKAMKEGQDPAEQPEAVTHGEMPDVLKNLMRVFTPTDITYLVPELTCVGHCHQTLQPHLCTEGALNGEEGWMECECQTCFESVVWHRASNHQTNRYKHGVVLPFKKVVQ